MMRICASIYHWSMGLLPETRNVIQMGASFFFIFLAFNSQGFIEQTVIESANSIGNGSNIDEHAGYTSQALIYLIFTFANFVAAPIVDVLSAKWGMVIGGICYIIFLAGFLFLNSPYLYASSCLLGFGAAVIWTGQGTYLSKNCDERTSGRNSSMLWAMLQASMLGGGLFLFIIFKATGTTTTISMNTTHIVYGVFTGLAIVGVVVIAFLPAPPAHLSASSDSSERTNYIHLIISTFKLMPKPRMLMLALAFSYTGLIQSFWSSVYPSCISFTAKLSDDRQSLVAINAMCSGAGQCIAGGIFGVFASRTSKLGRDIIVFMGAIIHLAVLAVVYINFPHNANLKPTTDDAIITPSIPLALICGFLLGFGDACWNTQIYSHLVANFSHCSSQAFALYKFYQSAFSCAAFFYSSHLELPWHILIMLVTSIIAAIAFFATERLGKREEKMRAERKKDDDEGYENGGGSFSETTVSF